MRKTSLLVFTWMIGAVLAVGLALQGVSLFDSQFVENLPNAKSQSAVRAQIRERQEAATTTTTVPVATSTEPATTTTLPAKTSTAPTTTTTAIGSLFVPPTGGGLGSAGRPRPVTTTAPTPTLATPITPPPEPSPIEVATSTQPPTTLPPEPTSTAPLRVVHTFASLGGSIGVGFDGNVIDLDFFEPVSGYAAEVLGSGPSEVVVRFTNSQYRKTITVTIEAGTLVDRIAVRPVSG